MPLFECTELSKAFGGLQAVDKLTFHVDQQEIVSIIGPNGAGKTTVFNLISGFYRPDSGQSHCWMATTLPACRPT